MSQLFRRILANIQFLKVRSHLRSKTRSDAVEKACDSPAELEPRFLLTNSSSPAHVNANEGPQSDSKARRRSFPKAVHHRATSGRRAAKIPMKAVTEKPKAKIKALPESRWPNFLDSRLRASILRTGQIPDKDRFTFFALRDAGARTMCDAEKSRLKAQIEKAFDRYKNLYISGVMQQDIAQKQRDGATNAANRRYVDGTF